MQHTVKILFVSSDVDNMYKRHVMFTVYTTFKRDPTAICTIRLIFAKCNVRVRACELNRPKYTFYHQTHLGILSTFPRC